MLFEVGPFTGTLFTAVYPPFSTHAWPLRAISSTRTLGNKLKRNMQIRDQLNAMPFATDALFAEGGWPAIEKFVAELVEQWERENG